MSNDKKSISKLLRYLCMIFVITSGFMTIIGSGLSKSGNTDTNGNNTIEGNETAPSIGDLTFSPAVYVIDSGGKAVPITGSISFSDGDGNMSTLRIVLSDAAGNELDTIDQPAGVSGSTSGTLNFTFDIDSSRSAYSFEVQVIDATNLVSNVLSSGALTGNTPTAPLIGDLAYTPTEVVLEGGGGAVEISGTMTFMDKDADVSTISISIFNSAGVQVGTPITQSSGVSGTASGSISFIFYVDSSAATSNYTFKIHAIDAAGLSSNELTGDGNASGNLNSPPVIGNLAFDPITSTGVEPGASGGWSSVKGSFNFLDIEAKTSTLVVNIYNEDKSTLISTFNQPAEVFGTTSGTVSFEAFFDDYMNDTDPSENPRDHSTHYMLEASVIDSSGLVSNTVQHHINVGYEPPEIWDLKVAWKAGALDVVTGLYPVTVTAGLWTWDDDADVDTITIEVVDWYSLEQDAGVYGSSDYAPISGKDLTCNLPAGIYEVRVWVTDKLRLDSINVDRNGELSGEYLSSFIAVP
jgi:hypothetical protein